MLTDNIERQLLEPGLIKEELRSQLSQYLAHDAGFHDLDALQLVNERLRRHALQAVSIERKTITACGQKVTDFEVYVRALPPPEPTPKQLGELVESQQKLYGGRVLAIFHQGGGCEYTINCGCKAELLPKPIKTLAAGIKYVSQLNVDRDDSFQIARYQGDYGLERVELFVVTETAVLNPGAVYDRLEQRRAKRKQSDQKRKEIELRDQLLKKYPVQ